MIPETPPTIEEVRKELQNHSKEEVVETCLHFISEHDKLLDQKESTNQISIGDFTITSSTNSLQDIQKRIGKLINKFGNGTKTSQNKFLYVGWLMVNKTSEIKAMVEPKVKKKFVDKAKEMNLSITGFIEKVAEEPIVFMDANVKKVLFALR